jgi:hypothetical protein
MPRADDADRAPRALLPLLLLAPALCACIHSRAESPAPPAWRVDLAHARTSVHGAWALVALRSGETVSGELLAVSGDALFLGATPRFFRVRGDCIARVNVAGYENDDAGPLIWGVLLTISTVTHGWFVPLTAPLVSAGMSIGRTLQGQAGHVRPGRDAAGFEGIRPWARYPQGMPIAFVERLPYTDLGPSCRPPLILKEDIP